MIYSVDEIVPIISEGVINKRKLIRLPNNKRVRLSKTLRIFHHCGVKCVKCGIVGIVFREVKHDGKRHLRLFGMQDGVEIMMTRDHIIPKSKGGSENFSNMQTMCCECNSKKQNEVNSSLLEKSLYSYKSIKDFIFNAYPESPTRERFSVEFSNIVRKIRDRRIHFGLICGSLEEISQYLSHIKKAYGFSVPINKITRVPYRRESCLFITQQS